MGNKLQGGMEQLGIWLSYSSKLIGQKLHKLGQVITEGCVRLQLESQARESQPFAKVSDSVCILEECPGLPDFPLNGH